MSSPAVLAAALVAPRLGAADLPRLHAIATLAREAGHAAVVALLADDGMEEDEEGGSIQGLHFPHELYDVQDAYTQAYEQTCHHYRGTRILYTAYLAALCDDAVFMFADGQGDADPPRHADWPRRICEEVLALQVGHEVALRGMPVWALKMVRAQFEWRRAHGMPYPPYHDPGLELPATRAEHDTQKEWEKRTETSVVLELDQRHHNSGRTLYLQSNAALWVEGWVARVAPGMNPRPVQSLIANFLSLSFNHRTPVVPRYPAAAPAPAAAAAAAPAPAPHGHKRGHDDEEEKEQGKGPAPPPSNRPRKQQ